MYFIFQKIISQVQSYEPLHSSDEESEESSSSKQVQTRAGRLMRGVGVNACIMYIEL